LLHPCDRTLLASGDTLTIGERQFIFEYPALASQQVAKVCAAVTRTLP
jgi:hypothetical protein